MGRHCDSAAKAANFLETHPAVSRVYYSGLESCLQHALAARQMRRFGGMIAFKLHGGFNAGLAMMNRLWLIHRAVPLDNAESLVEHPASMTNATYTQAERRKHGIRRG